MDLKKQSKVVRNHLGFELVLFTGLQDFFCVSDRNRWRCITSQCASRNSDKKRVFYTIDDSPDYVARTTSLGGILVWDRIDEWSCPPLGDETAGMGQLLR